MRIRFFDSLRGIWAILIFLCHWTLLFGYNTRMTHGGGYGVAGFLILSGYLIVLKHGNEFENINLKTLLLFVYKRMKDTYLLYILSMFPFAVCDLPKVISYLSVGNKAWQNYVIKYACNTALLQSIIPGVGSVNGVGWYLSCIFFVYLVSPFLYKINYIILKKRLTFWVGIGLCFLAASLLCRYESMYGNPLMRIFQFEIGMLLAGKGSQAEIIKYKLWKIGLWCGVFLSIASFWADISSINMLITNISVALLVICGAKQQNVCAVIPMISNRVFEGMGKYSGAFYLIHYPVISILGGWLVQTLWDETKKAAILYGVILFGISILLSIIYTKSWEKIKRKV